MGVHGSRRAGPRPLLRLAFRKGAIGAPLEINARSIVIASVSEAIQENVVRPAAPGSPRRPVGLLAVTIQSESVSLQAWPTGPRSTPGLPPTAATPSRPR